MTTPIRDIPLSGIPTKNYIRVAFDFETDSSQNEEEEVGKRKRINGAAHQECLGCTYSAEKGASTCNDLFPVDGQ